MNDDFKKVVGENFEKRDMKGLKRLCKRKKDEKLRKWTPELKLLGANNVFLTCFKYIFIIFY